MANNKYYEAVFIYNTTKKELKALKDKEVNPDGSVGMSFDDFNATIAAISPLFNSGTDAGTGLKTFIQRLVPTTNEAADAIESLRQDVLVATEERDAKDLVCKRLEEQLAAMTAERDEWKACAENGSAHQSVVQQLAAMTQERDSQKKAADHWFGEANRDHNELLKALAREQELREAAALFRRYASHDVTDAKGYAQAVAALALPHDDTALRQAQAKVLRDAATYLEPDSVDHLLRMADELSHE